jgi:tryptophanyl-tRNA synthetase
VKNLMGILSAVTGESVPSIAARFEGQGYGYLKVAVAEAVTEELAPVQRRLHELLADPAELDRQLAASAAEVRETAAATMARVRAAVGIG